MSMWDLFICSFLVERVIKNISKLSFIFLGYNSTKEKNRSLYYPSVRLSRPFLLILCEIRPVITPYSHKIGKKHSVDESDSNFIIFSKIYSSEFILEIVALGVEKHSFQLFQTISFKIIFCFSIPFLYKLPISISKKYGRKKYYICFFKVFIHTYWRKNPFLENIYISYIL